MKLTTTLIALIAASSAFTAQAQSSTTGPRIEAGLWEIDMTIKSQTGKAEMAMREAQAYISRLPPDQRRQVEQMMAQQGVKLGDRTSSLKACISKEDAERGTIPQQAGDCTQEVLEKNANSMKVKFSCATNPPANGEAVVEFPSSSTYTSRAIVDTVVLGQAERVNVEQTGRWVGADCGSVRPLGK